MDDLKQMLRNAWDMRWYYAILLGPLVYYVGW
ncbi:hypothetical protein DFP87_1357 [Achromobacter marplatensis]|uniref:Uncharacterized protein n=1 Tax=Achromobacter marplatensis TaxID=470868 RepID=A0ABX9FS97_9BURK|nr:hypothetical protein DFP87_1357 [Achromobacter marplatensis]CAB3717261.1 hypothetical protein LMG26219_06316 [Achromobacter marplatensis]